MNFPERLKREREKKEISQTDLARLIGISNVMLSRYESGKRTPDFKTLEALADYFGCTTDYLLGRTDTFNPIELDTTPKVTAIFKFPNLSNTSNTNIEHHINGIRDVVYKAVDDGKISSDYAAMLVKEATSYLKFKIEEQNRE